MKTFCVFVFWFTLTLVSSLAHAQVTLTLITSSARIPLDMASTGDANVFLVVEQGGRVMRLNNGIYEAAPFIDLSGFIASGGERGLLGIALHPQFKTNGHLFVNYTRAGDGATVIARFTRSATNPTQAEISSQKILMTITQPYANHNGGALRFGPDGYLYIGMGDGGSANDPQNFAQNMGSLLGKILRIDVNQGEPYGVPLDNPFAPNPSAGRKEIFAAGLRNPWRFSFDRLNGDLYIGDVGQDALEEIDLIGAVTTAQLPRTLINFGWRTYEGSRCTNLDGAAACVAGQFSSPILEYGRSDGQSVTGGYRYSGSAVTELVGGYHYVFGDYVSGRIWRGTRDANGVWRKSVLIKAPGNIASFAQDDAGELYVLDGKTSIYKLGSNTTSTPSVAGTAKEYFNGSLGHYFITSDVAEQGVVESGGAGPGWQATGLTFKVLNDVSTVLPAPGIFFDGVCRFYGRPGVGPNSHFYTSDQNECNFVRGRDPGWQYEGTSFYVVRKTGANICPGGHVPVYRSYNKGFPRNDSNHRYSADLATHQGMIARGWADEGVVFCALPS